MPRFSNPFSSTPSGGVEGYSPQFLPGGVVVPQQVSGLDGPITQAFSNLSKALVGPSPLQQQMYQTQQAAQQAIIDKSRFDLGQGQKQDTARGVVAQAVIDGMQGPLPSEPRPDPNFTGPMPEMLRPDYARQKYVQALGSAEGAGLGAGPVTQTFFQAMKAQPWASPADISNFAPGMMEANQRVNVADRDAVFAQDHANKLALQNNANAANMARTQAQIGEQRYQFDNTPDANSPDTSPAPVAPATAGLAGDDLLKALQPADAAQVQAIAEGRMAVPTGAAMRSPYWQNMMQTVAQYDPSFDATDYSTRAATRRAFASGKEAASVNAINTAVGHLQKLSDYVGGLGNTDIPLVNGVKNWAATNTGSPRVTDFQSVVQPVVAELTRAWRGTGGSVQDINDWESKLNAASSPAQLNSVIANVTDLLGSKVNALNDQYHQAMGARAGAWSATTPETQQILATLQQRAGRGAPAAVQQGRMNAVMGGNAPSGPAAGSVVGGYRFKGGNPNDPSSWEAAQ